MTELVIILGLALLLLGPDQLPQLARSLGKGLRELRRATDDIKSQFEQEIARVDLDPPQRMIAPVPPPADAAGAGAAAATSGDAAAAVKSPPVPDDPAAARAAARRAAAEAQLKLVPPEGTVPKEPKA